MFPLSVLMLSHLCPFYLSPSLSLFILFFSLFIFLLLNYILLIITITVVPIFPPLLPSTQRPPLPHQFPHHCSCLWVLCISSSATPFPILYFTSPWLFYNYLFALLQPLFSSLNPSHPPPIWESSKHSLYP